MKKILLSTLLAVSLSGCAHTDVFDNMAVSEAQVTDTTRSGEILKNLPLPEQRVPVSVYEFQDQTGQFKTNERITEYSSAVTKGGLSVLTKALLDSGNHKWFMVAERGGLKNLMQERAIVRAMRQDYADANGQALQSLPPLIYGGVLLEGGIVFYDSNIMTGGAGARYFGIGGSAEYRRDIVTVYLRATSIQNGEVLLSVTSSKTIFSYGLSASLSRYLSFDKLLEAEAGFTVNEPSQLAVRQAIETSVYSMIMEGAINGLWGFENKAAGQRAIMEYLKRRDSAKSEADIMRDIRKNQTVAAKARQPEADEPAVAQQAIPAAEPARTMAVEESPLTPASAVANAPLEAQSAKVIAPAAQQPAATSSTTAQEHTAYEPVAVAEPVADASESASRYHYSTTLPESRYSHRGGIAAQASSYNIPLN